MRDIEDLVLQIVDRRIAERYSERHGLVTSYDPKRHLGKVTLQPEGQETGWLPIETGHIGSGYGIALGLQPGSGKGDDAGASSAVGDQVIVRFQEGDVESGKIVQRVHSDRDPAPEVQAGEVLIWAKFKGDSNPGPNAQSQGGGGDGQKIYLKNDGSITMTDGNGASIVMDGKGNVTISAKKLTITGSDDVVVKSTDKTLDLRGKPIKANGGGDTIPPWTCPG